MYNLIEFYQILFSLVIKIISSEKRDLAVPVCSSASDHVQSYTQAIVDKEFFQFDLIENNYAFALKGVKKFLSPGLSRSNLSAGNLAEMISRQEVPTRISGGQRGRGRYMEPSLIFELFLHLC